LGSVVDLVVVVVEVRVQSGEARRDDEKDSIWAVKSRSKLVVSLSLYARRGVGEGVRSERRTVEGVCCVRARGVAYERVSR